MKRPHLIGPLLTVVLAASVPGSLGSQTEPEDWNLGDVFVGIGELRVDAGKYLVFHPDGTRKAEMLVDSVLSKPPDNRSAVTTGCAIGPPQVGDALYTTSFYALKVRKFASTHPHAQSTVYDALADTSAQFAVTAFESIVFDKDGNYYVGAHGPQQESAQDPVSPWGYIYKFDSADRLLQVLQVPNGARGVDWLDLGSDNRTLYYTSESNTIQAYDPADPGSYRKILIHESTAPGVGIGGRSYAVRALPPVPGDPRQAPSGFLVATNAGPIRTDPNGRILYRYRTPGASGSFFSLNLTPDGRHFWTANFPAYDTATGQNVPGSGGQLFKYHISQVDPIKGPIATGAVNGVWGTCIKREYTAAFNTCFQTDAQGNAVLVNGAPVPFVCRVPEICGNAIDEDDDGFADAEDADCAPPGSPLLVHPPDQTNYEGDVIDPLQVSASDPDGDALTLSITGLPPGLSMSASGLITGTIAWGASGAPRVVRVMVSDGTRSTSRTFLWHVLHRNGPPELEHPGDFVCLLGDVCPDPGSIKLSVRDPDLDSVFVTVPAGSRPAAPGVACTTGMPCTGLPPGMSAPSFVPSGGLAAYSFGLAGRPTHSGTFLVQVCVVDQTIEEVTRTPECETFTITVRSGATNRPPDAGDDRAAAVGSSPTLIDVRANDSDPDGDHVSLVPAGFTQPANGTVTLGADGRLLYVANLGFAGEDTFTYTISDGLLTDVATVRLTVEDARVCYIGRNDASIGATQDWWYNLDGSLTIRTTLSRTFTDNTYGANAVGWPGGRDQGNHRFGHLVSSDMVQVALFDSTNARRMEMKLDYLSESPLFGSGYGSLGVDGGDGGLMLGSAAHVLAADSSLGRNFNQLGYRLTTDSPATDAAYAPSPDHPNWIFDAWYEVTVSPAAFVANRFSHPRITAIHASPSKIGRATEPLNVVACASAAQK